MNRKWLFACQISLEIPSCFLEMSWNIFVFTESLEPWLANGSTWAKSRLLPGFVNSLVGARSHPLTPKLSAAAFKIQRESSVVAIEAA